MNTTYSKVAIPKTTMDGQGVTALDLSHNAFTDVLIIEISPILRSNAPLVGNLLTLHVVIWLTLARYVCNFCHRTK
jgi:hypothetical protein